MLTGPERDALLQHLDQTAQNFRDAIAGLTPEQWNFSPADEAWSIAGIAEHLIVSETNVLERVRTVLLESPPIAPELAAKSAQRDSLILTRVATDRGVKAQAPPHSHPQGRWTSAAQALAAFNHVRASVLDYAATTQDDLRGHFFPHPALRDLDGYQWLLLIGSHAARHGAQIAEVKAAPGFPHA
jgi:hypothetical protein